MASQECLNFFKGYATLSLLPAKEIIEATTELLSPESRDYDQDRDNRHPLIYGSDEGSRWVRQSICDLTNDAFQLKESVKSKPEYINLTSGASYGILNLLAQTTLPHTGYTRQAFIISPTYFLINEAFVDAGFGDKITAINELEDSIDLEALRERLEYFDSIHDKEDHSKDHKIINAPGAEKLKKIYKYVLYMVPTFSNPGGRTYSLESRKQVIEIARKHDMLIISDDVYDLLNYEQPLDSLPHPMPRLTFLDRESYVGGDEGFGNTISNATFSKVVAPGLRFGYQESVNKNLVSQLSRGGANASGGTPSQLNSMVVGTMIKNGECTRILQHSRAVYKERCQILYDCIKKCLPSQTEYTLQTGGYFSWVTLPEGYNCREICAILMEKHNVIIPDGSWFEVVGDPKGWDTRSCRLSISFLSADQIERGIKIWGGECKKYAISHNLKF